MFFCFLAKKVVDFGKRIQEPEYMNITQDSQKMQAAQERKRGEMGDWESGILKKMGVVLKMSLT